MIRVLGPRKRMQCGSIIVISHLPIFSHTIHAVLHPIRLTRVDSSRHFVQHSAVYPCGTKNDDIEGGGRREEGGGEG